MGSVNASNAPYFASTALNAPQMRLAMGAVWADSPSGAGTEAGVVPSGGNANSAFTPSSTGSAGAPAITVQPGQCVIQRAVGGTYVGTLTASVSLLIDTPLPSAGQTRWDVLCATIVDGEADGGTPPQTCALQFITVKGTAGASPSVPSVPAGYLPLYNVLVTNGGSLTFTDVRTFTRGVGGLRFVAAGDVRAGSYPADQRIFATGQVDTWLFVNSTWQWITTTAPAIWTQINVNYSYAGGSGGTINFGTGGTSICRYKRSSNDLALSYEAILGSAGWNMGTGRLSTVLPNGWVTPAGRDQWIPCHLYCNDAVSGFNGDIAGLALVNGGSNVITPWFPINPASNVWMQPYLVVVTAGVNGQSVPVVPGGYAMPTRLHIAGSLELAS